MSLKMSLNSQIKVIMKAIFAKYDADNSGFLDES
jgi:hypothetical protein